MVKGYLRLLGLLRPHLGVFGISIAAMTVYAALDAFSFALLGPLLEVLFNGRGAGAAPTGDVATFGRGSPLGRLLDRVVNDALVDRSPMAALERVMTILFAVFLIKNVALYVERYTVNVVEGRVTRDLRRRIYSHLLQLGLPFYGRTRTGQIISRVTSDVDQLRALVTNNLAKALSSLVQVIFFLACLFAISWKLTAVALLCLPPMLALWRRFRKRLRAGVMRVLNSVGDVSSHVQETVAGIRLVKVFGAEEFEAVRFRELTQRHYKAQTRNDRWRQFFSPATEMITATATLALLWYGGYLVLVERSLEPKLFVVALGLALRMMTPVKFLGNYPATVQPGLAAADRSWELLETEPEIVEAANATPVPARPQTIRFEGVGFEYLEGVPTLRDIDLDLKAGQVVALVGPSGAGKSTLADLLPRLHDPTSGRILVDGADLRQLRLTELRRRFGVVTQETILFHDTVRANIAYGTPDPRPAEIEAAARAANAHDFIMALPEGYDTVLGERGLRLSGGQRQRIAIARALFRNPPVLILDEATSALDTESERLVQAAVDRLLRDRTVLVIAHRLSTVRRADLILVMEAGRIVERGTHDELLARGGLYARLHALQFAADADLPSGELLPPLAMVSGLA